jgi:HEAT repeat protein
MQQIIEQLAAPDLRARLEAAAALMTEGSAALDWLLPALDHPVEEIRWRAATVLGWIGDARAIEPLYRRGQHEDYAVKYNVAWALGQINDPAAIPHLMEIVLAGESESPDVRYNAAMALARLGQTERLAQALVGTPEPVYRVAHAALASYARVGG